MGRKLFVSVEAIELKGKEYFDSYYVFSDAIKIAMNGEYAEYDGLLVSMDDMGDIDIRLNKYDEAYELIMEEK